MTKTEFIEKAKELNAKIELIVEVDVNDADYIHEIQEYSVEEFEKYNIFDDYVKLKALEQRRGLWHIMHKKHLIDGMTVMNISMVKLNLLCKMKNL